MDNAWGWLHLDVWSGVLGRGGGVAGSLQIAVNELKLWAYFSSMLVPPGRPLSPERTRCLPVGTREKPYPARELLCLPACTFTPILCTHSAGGATNELRLVHHFSKVLALSGQPPRHGEAAPCAHRRPVFVVREPPWLVLPACVFTLHIYSAHLLCTLTLLHFTPRTSTLLYGALSARPCLHILSPL